MFDIGSFFLGNQAAGTALPMNQNNMPQLSPDQWNNNPANFAPNQAQIGTQTGGLIDGIGKFFDNPANQAAMAKLGAALDPQGPGGAIGGAALSTIQSKQAGKAGAKVEDRWESLIKALGDGKVGKLNISQDAKSGKTSLSLSGGDGLGSLAKDTQQPQAAPDSFASVIQKQAASLDNLFGSL